MGATSILEPSARQPFPYPLTREFAEPDWTRLPGFRGVTEAEWESALWQRRHTVKNLKEFRPSSARSCPSRSRRASSAIIASAPRCPC